MAEYKIQNNSVVRIDTPSGIQSKEVAVSSDNKNSQSLESFIFGDMLIRTTLINGEPYFLAMDIAKILEYSDTEAMTRRLDSDEIQNLQIVGFGNRGVNFINESGLYNAIIGSKKLEAKPFRQWVVNEVLPQIRKTGSYSLQQQLPQNYIETLEALIVKEKERLAQIKL